VTSSRSPDVIVIGAGIIGCSIALALARAGRRVLVVDKNPAAGYGSTSSSSAVIRTFYSTHAGCALAWEGLQHWRDMAAYLAAPKGEILASYTECGAVLFRSSAQDGFVSCLAHHDTIGIPYDLWTPADMAARLPGLDLRSFDPPRAIDDPAFGAASAPSLYGGIHFPASGYVNDPQLATRTIQDAAKRAGADFKFGAAVTAIQTQGGAVRGIGLADGGAIDAPVVVNAAGPYSSRINALARVSGDMTVTTRPMRQEVAYVPAPKDAPRHVLGDIELGTYSRPDGAGGWLVGSTEPACDHLQWIEDPDDFERSHTDAWTAHVYRQAVRMPSLGIPGQATGVVDLYDVTEDWMPIYDRSGLEGFYMAIGTSGNQFKNGLVAGRLMAGVIDYCEDGGDHDGKPLQVRLPYTGETLDMAAFSRLRPVNTESSASVFG
jgi:sarcosine oxidase subunit beta